MILFFDIDGTLIHSASTTHRLALLDAASSVFNLHLTLEDYEQARPDGETDLLIVRHILEAKGISDEEISAARDELISAAMKHVSEIAAPGSVDVLPTVPQALAALQEEEGFRLALLTGNLEPFAWAKVQSAGIEEFFERGQGAYGTDAEQRTSLGPIALSRAALTPADAWVIGDTPHDIACARAATCRVVATATGHYAVAQLQAADHVIEKMIEITVLPLRQAVN